MSPRSLDSHGPPAFFQPLQFGGWGDYQKWADHDFLPCPRSAQPEIENKDATSESPETPSVSTESPDALDAPLPEAGADPIAADPIAADWGAVQFQYETELVVRPYVRTGGRAAPTHDLRLETLLRAVPSWRQQPHAQELSESSDIGRICALSEGTLSLAELSAYLRAPLGVVRVLVDDAVNLGLVSIPQHEASAACPSMDLLRRVHQGLLRLH